MRFEGLVIATALWIGACGSSGAGGPTTPSSGTGNGAISGSGSTSGSSTESCGMGSLAVWKEDGTTHCATSGEAIIGSSTAENVLDGGRLLYTSLEVVLLQSSSTESFGFIVTSDGALDGTYSCMPSPSSVGELTYDEPGVFSTTVASCDITVTLTPTGDGGMTVSGTFSAVLNVTGGGTKTLSDGTFTMSVVESS
jgi:hypothetical protein